MSDCLFCKIAAGELPSNKVYEDENVFAFHDLNPKAPTHVLIIPRQHIATINDIQPENSALVGQLYLTAKQIAQDMGFSDAGYRVVMNCNQDAGQTVFHIHLHLLGGRQLGWPPG